MQLIWWKSTEVYVFFFYWIFLISHMALKLIDWLIDWLNSYSSVCFFTHNSNQCSMCTLIVPVVCSLWTQLLSIGEAYCSLSLHHPQFIHSANVRVIFSLFYSSSSQNLSMTAVNMSKLSSLSWSCRILLSSWLACSLPCVSICPELWFHVRSALLEIASRLAHSLWSMFLTVYLSMLWESSLLNDTECIWISSYKTVILKEKCHCFVWWGYVMDIMPVLIFSFTNLHIVGSCDPSHLSFLSSKKNQVLYFELSKLTVALLARVKL